MQIKSNLYSAITTFRPGRLLIPFVLCQFIASCTTPPQTDLTVSQAVIKRPLTGKTKTVAYFELKNNSAATKVLSEIHSGIAGAIEIHTTVKTGAVMRMQRLNEIAIPAYSSVTFSPGGNHLMLFRVDKLTLDIAYLEFRFSDGSTYEIEFAIEDY